MSVQVGGPNAEGQKLGEAVSGQGCEQARLWVGLGYDGVTLWECVGDD
jgi:hypothetical protein